jgi:hypothetical protein
MTPAKPWRRRVAGTTNVAFALSDTIPHSRGAMRPSFVKKSFASNQRAQGMPGARCARSLACKIKKHTSVVTTVTPATPGIPRAMVLTVSFVLSPASRALLPPSSAVCLRQLDTGVRVSGPHDFSVRRLHVRQRAACVHRIPSRVRDDREPPPWKERDAAFIIQKFDLVKLNSEIQKSICCAGAHPGMTSQTNDIPNKKARRDCSRRAPTFELAGPGAESALCQAL